MRERPPDDTLRWMIDALDPHAEVIATTAIRGGSTAAMHRVTIRRPGGVERTVDLRRYVLVDILDQTPDVATCEAHALDLVAALSIPTPELLAVDPTALWTPSRLTGVVDWQAACLGPASIDVGHCRLNMLYYDTEQADALRTAWERAAGRRYDPWADVMSIIGVLDSLRTAKRAARYLLEIERTLAQAVAALTG